MASGQTILQGWRSLGRWAIWYFVVYLFIVTFVFGAAVTSTAALAVDAAFPGVLPLWAWAALHSVAAFAVVGIGRYGLFERIMKTFAALKFGIVILLAILLAPSLGEVVLGFVPRIPEGALINVLAIIGGVGGTYSLAAYTYWVRERGWRHSDWIPTMRTDLAFGYALTALFMVSMLIIGAELLFGTGTSISDEEGHPGAGRPHAGPIRSPGTLGIPHRFLGRRDRRHARSLERRRPPLCGLCAHYPRGAGRGGIRLPLRKEHLLPSIPGLDVVPAHDPARLRRAGPAGDRLRLARCSFPALFGDYAAHTPELPACGPRVS